MHRVPSSIEAAMASWFPYTITKRKPPPAKEKAAAVAKPQEAPPSPPPPGPCSKENPCMAAYIMENLRNYPGEINIQIGRNRRQAAYGGGGGGGSSIHPFGGGAGGSSIPPGRLPPYQQQMQLDYGYDDYDDDHDYGRLQRSLAHPLPQRYNNHQMQQFQCPGSGGYDPYNDDDDYGSHRPFAMRPRPYNNRMPLQHACSAGYDYDDYCYGYGHQRPFAPLFDQARDFYGRSGGYY
ncbi:OLC1v1024197C1 [Oldenlandia corymbosa var. corymbosa]|uniref:OLC1v1024197C1 n=1 Tax=Oldenlandia corymbosa var. corymbosa TaxID=529605 RepID=A0AAV1C254_OLDCO|nr:OLC1v1024197C1 [Oldenlandia corymbosa var. corymbosa]